MGFEVDDKKLKRAGLDYWHALDITYYDDIDDFNEKNPDAELFFFSTKAENKYTDVKYPQKVYLVFGREDAGLPEELLKANRDRCVRLPMRDNLRSLNLSNTAAIAVYEVLRQRNFDGLKTSGELARLSWND
jgi:tRNA (cytidine/uridine-2'-O-)-methyltransferase